MTVRGCPFPGLLPFDEKDASFFFGRDDEIRELLQRLQRNRFIAVIGVSGSGKSSLVRAGLKPELRISEPPWRLVEIKPGGAPRQHLRRGLESVLPGPGWGELLGKSSYGLVDGVATAGLQADEKVLIIVDQFEEIFSFRKRGNRETEEADLFVQQLLRAGAEPGLAACVMLTMRTDFLGHCALFRGLPEALNRGTYLVPRLTRQQQEEAITAPLSVSGVDIEPAVVDHLLNAAEANRDELPVLQHLLKRLWEEWASEGGSGKIAAAETERTGSWTNAIDLDADSVFQSLDGPAQNAVSLVFKRITEKGSGERPIRTPCSLEDLNRLVEEVATAQQLRDTLQRFRSRDLLVWTSEARAADERVDIPHECVTWRWERLAGWIEEEDRDALRLAFIAESARSGTPLAGSALSEALVLRPRITDAWVARYKLNAVEATNWIDYSQREAARMRTRARNVMVGLALACLLFAALGLWALQQRRSARISAQLAVEREKDAKTAADKALAAASQATLAKDEAVKAQMEAVNSRNLAEKAEKEALIERARAENLASRLDAQLAISKEVQLGRDARANVASVSTSGTPQISAADLASIMPSSSEQARAAFLQPLNRAMEEFGINTRVRQAHFLGQIAHESGSLRFVTEIWKPTAFQLRYEPPGTLAQALGNTEKGDGQRYRGRGLILITGRANYRRFGDALGVDLIGEPDLAARPDVAARIAAMFWSIKGLNELADRDDPREITRRINGGFNGLTAREEAVERAKKTLGVTPKKRTIDPRLPEKVHTMITQQLGVGDEEVRYESSFVDDLGADSLDRVELVMAVEEEFGIEVPDEDAEKIGRVGELVEYLQQRKVLK